MVIQSTRQRRPPTAIAATPYYSGFGNQTPPLAQQALFPQQTASTAVGPQGFAWRDVVIDKSGNSITCSIDGTLIAAIDLTTVSFGGGNILFNQCDINQTASSDPNAASLLFGLIDNVRWKFPNRRQFGWWGSVLQPSVAVSGGNRRMPRRASRR
jgi:hypothetical protein